MSMFLKEYRKSLLLKSITPNTKIHNDWHSQKGEENHFFGFFFSRRNLFMAN